MLFAAKQKGFFVELNADARLLARTSASSGPMVVEQLSECPLDDDEAWAEIVEATLPKKAAHGFLRSVCGVYPEKRLVRRATIDPKKLKEENYLTEFASSQFRIEPDQYLLALLKAQDGSEYDTAHNPSEKEVIVCGMPNETVITMQDRLLEVSVYPDRMELGTLAGIGALADYLKFVGNTSPVVVLELEADTTHSYIVSGNGLEMARVLPQGLNAMIPVVQKELGLKDEESARKLFYSNTFDFTGMGPTLVRRLIKELQSSIGFFEVQTGQSIGGLFCLLLPQKLSWLEAAIANQLGVEVLKPKLAPWLESKNVTLADGVAGADIDRKWFGIFSLMVRHDVLEKEIEKED